MNIVELNSEVFQEMRQNLNVSILAVLKEIHKDNFASGDISLKLTIGRVTEFEKVPDGHGGLVNKPYKMPVFEHKINISLQKKDSIGGQYVATGKELVYEDGLFELVDVEKAQMEMEI